MARLPFKFWNILKMMLVFLPISCAQHPVPENRPKVENQDFDKKIASMLRFSTPVIGVDELKEQRDEVILLDARKREEFDQSHIPGALFVGYGGSFEESALENIPKNTRMVLYCSIGYRSEKMGDRLRSMGYIKVQNLYGSIFEWANRGYPLEDRFGNKTNLLHTYNRNWSKWVDNREIQKTW